MHSQSLLRGTTNIWFCIVVVTQIYCGFGFMADSQWATSVGSSCLLVRAEKKTSLDSCEHNFVSFYGSIENKLIFLPPIKTLVPKMHLLEFETVPLSLYSSNNVCGAGSLSTSKMAPYQVLTFKTSMNPLRFCICGKCLQRPSLAKQTWLHQISRPQCSSGWYQAFTWTSVLLLAGLDSWLCPKDNPRTPLCLSLPSAPDLGTLGWRIGDSQGADNDKKMIVKKWQNKLDRRRKTKQKTDIQRQGFKSCSSWRFERTINTFTDQSRSRSQWTAVPFVLLRRHRCVQQCFIDAAVYLRSPVYNARLPRQKKENVLVVSLNVRQNFSR